MAAYPKTLLSPTLVLLFILLMGCPAWAQGAAEPSGIYQTLKLGVDSATGIVTGYYQDGPDDPDNDNQPDSTCVLYLYGKKNGEVYSIQTFKPKAMTPGVTGELSFVQPKKDSGKPEVRLKLNKPGVGCWQANPRLAKPEGDKLSLDKRENWTAVRIVTAEKTYFFDSPEATAPRKSRLKRGDVVAVTEARPGWVLADNLIRDKGWLKEEDLFSVQP